MKAKVIDNGNFIQIIDANEIELKQIYLSFKKRINHWRFHPLVKKKLWDGYIKFIDKYNRIPIGLWYTLNTECKKYGFELEFEGIDYIINKQFNQEEFEKWVWDFFKDSEFGKGGKKELREYQIQAAADTIKYYKSRSELATSSGKTIIIFIILAYLEYKNWAKKHLIIVPNISLIIQTAEAFEEYAKNTPLEGKLKIQLIGGGNKPKNVEDKNIIIGTFQSLRNLSKSFFSDIETVCVDEAHYTNSKSVKNIIIKSFHSKYRFGFSGTLLSDDSAESMTLDAYLGPIVNRISAKFLILNSFATPIFVKSLHLDYLDEKTKEKLYNLRKRKGKDIDGGKLLDIEKKIVIENKKRFKFICDLLEKTTKNTLVLFYDIKYGYGKKFYHYIRENFSDKIVFYVDGNTPSEIREEYKLEMENGDNKILIASFGTFSTGISINNIHHIFFLESYKSDKLIRQSIGRGMRLFEGKKKLYIWDFVDDFRYGNIRNLKNNYLYNHGLERLKIYEKQGFPKKIYKIKI